MRHGEGMDDSTMHAIDDHADVDDEIYMLETHHARSSSVVDEQGRIQLHPRLMKKLGIGPGTPVHIGVRLGESYMYFEGDDPPHLHRHVDLHANAIALGARIRAAKAARGEGNGASDT